MSWKYETEDGKIDVIVEPEFRGDLLALASVRPVWIVETPHNRPIIDFSWAVGKNATFFEVNRYPVDNPNDRERNLFEIMESLDDHYVGYNLVVHGLRQSESLENKLAEEGFRITEATPESFAAERIPGVRDRLTGM